MNKTRQDMQLLINKYFLKKLKITVTFLSLLVWGLNTFTHSQIAFMNTGLT